MSILRPINETKEYIMIAEDGTIEGMTMGISQELQIPEGLIEQKELCMGDLCAEF